MDGSTKLCTLCGSAVVLPGSDIDTDQIVPARFLKEISFEKMGDYLFYDARFDAKAAPKDHPLNTKAASDASFLVVDDNFGCGSSREHAPQAIKRFGFKGIIGISFAEIFANNCKEIGLPVVTVKPDVLPNIVTVLSGNPHFNLRLNLETKRLDYGDFSAQISLPEDRRQAFIQGTWNVLALLKANEPAIRDKAKALPYLYF